MRRKPPERIRGISFIEPVESGRKADGMLVLSRHKNESIMVGEIEVTVLEVRGCKVRLGISAPPEVPVHRREIFDAIQREKGDKGEQPKNNQ